MHSTPSSALIFGGFQYVRDLTWRALIFILEPQHKVNALEGVECLENLLLESMCSIFFQDAEKKSNTCSL